MAKEIIAAGLTPHLADPAEAAHLRGPKRRAKTDRADALHQRVLLEQGRLPECWVPPSHVLECRALLETYLDLREQRTGWVQRIHAVLFHHGAPNIAGQRLGTAEGAAALRAAAARCSPAGQLQVAIAAQMLLVYDERLHQVRRQLLDRARHTRGAAELTARLYGVGPVTGFALTCWLGGAGRFSSSPQGGPVRRAGHHRVLLRRQALAGAPVPAGTGGAALGALLQRGKAHARAGGPDHAYYAQVKERIDGKRAALSEARKIIRQAVHILAGLGDDALTAC